MLVFIFFLPLTSPIVCFLSGPGLQGLQSKQTSSFTAVCSSAKWRKHTAIPKPGKRSLQHVQDTKQDKEAFLIEIQLTLKICGGYIPLKNCKFWMWFKKCLFFPSFFFKFKVSLNPKYAFVWRLMAFRTKRTTCR